MNNKTDRGKYILDLILKMLIYTLVLVIMSNIFTNTMYIDSEYYGMWSFLATIIIFVLNKTIKPLIVWMTLPITALTLGLFYPLINLFILWIVDFILGIHFNINGFFMAVLVAALISIVNYILDQILFKSILRKKIYE